MIATIGTKASNGPSFPKMEAFCAIPGKGMNIISLATMNKLSMGHYPTHGAFSDYNFVANPRTHNMFQKSSNYEHLQNSE